MYIYIYIERERERQTDKQTCVIPERFEAVSFPNARSIPLKLIYIISSN